MGCVLMWRISAIQAPVQVRQLKLTHAVVKKFGPDIGLVSTQLFEASVPRNILAWDVESRAVTPPHQRQATGPGDDSESLSVNVQPRADTWQQTRRRAYQGSVC